MEMIRNGRRIDARSGRSPSRGIALSLAINERSMWPHHLRLRRRRADSMRLGEMLRDDFVDLRLRVRLHPRFDGFEDAMPLNNHPEAAGFARFSQDLLEVIDRRVLRRVPVDGHQTIAGAESGALGRTVLDDRLDGDARAELDDLYTEVPAAGEHLTDDALAFRGRCGALFFVVRIS